MASAADSIDEYPRGVRTIGWTLLVVGVLLAVGVVATEGTDVVAPGLVALMAIAFAVAERQAVHVQVRSQAIAVSATEFLLVIGFFLLSPVGLLVARIVGGIPYRLRSNWTKNLVNTGLMLVATSAMVAVVHGVQTPDLREPLTWSVVLAAVGLGSLIDAVVLSAVVRTATRGRSRLGAEVALSMVVWGLVTASVSISGLLLSTIDPVATLFAVVPAVAVLLAYRALAHQRDEAARYRGAHEASARLQGDSELDVVAGVAVHEARELLRCAEAELVLRTPQGDMDLQVRLDHAGRVRSGVLADLPSVPAAIGWDDLATAGQGHLHDDAVVVPVAFEGELLGHLGVTGRPTGRAPFGPADRTALRAVAERIGAVVARSRLADELRTVTETSEFLESHDVLTGLGNRRWFVQEVERLARANASVSVALLNLRGFRRINEVHGQAAGDLLLVEVAESLRRLLPDRAAIARLAGDEFAVALPGGDVDRIARAVGVPVATRLGGEEVELVAAAGVARWPGEVDMPQGLLRAADLALVVARRNRAGGLVRYDPSLEESIARRSRIAADLRAALAAGDVRVHFQPLVDVATGTVVAAEALARWDHGDLGPIPPVEFVDVAEETGQVGALTRHVLDIAVRHAAAWQRAGSELEVAVNVSTQDLEGPDLVDVVRATLQTHGLPAHLLVLEVTETAMMTDRDRGVAVLSQLSDLGVGLAIDDFGTGHSSLAYLADLPVTEVKVDRVFVASLPGNQESELIVRAVVELAGRRDLVVVGEGVEDEAALDALRRLGVQRCQGWHTGRPVPADDFVRMLVLA